MTNTPDKSETVEQRAREIYKRSPDLFYHSHNETRGHRHWGDLTEERREHFRDLARASSRPADQVPDMRDALECARRDLNHLAAKYDEQEFVAPTICKIAALQAVPAASEVGWQPIESAPKDGTYVLIATPRHDGDMLVAMFDQSWGDDGWWLTDDGKNPEIPLRGPAPTHWRPLPEPPALKATGEE